MSVPTEFDFAVLKIGDGGGPEQFDISCGKQDITLTFAANSTDRFVRDCAKPGEVPFRKAKVTGKQLDISGSGLTDVTAFGTELEYLGKHKNVKVELYADDGTDAGSLLGTVSGEFLVNALTIGAPREGDSSAEIGLASNGEWAWDAA